VFVPNATQAVATVLANLEPTLKPGDELLAPGHEYPACMNNLRRAAQRTGAKVVTIPLPFPLKSPDQIVEAVMGAVTPRTRVLLISHITSPSALILPLERIVPELERRGSRASWMGHTRQGSRPRWMWRRLVARSTRPTATSGCARPRVGVPVHPRRPAGGFRPLALSNNAEKPRPGRKHLHTEFDYVGTADQTAYLCIRTAIDTMASLVPGGWPAIMRRNHELAIKARNHICATIGAEPPAPDSMLGRCPRSFSRSMRRTGLRG
jgi:isopenicillin-N epimerase